MSETSLHASDAVVVPAIGAPSTVAVCRSLGRRGVRTIVVTRDGNAAATRSRYCDETVTVPAPGTDAKGYVAALHSLAERPDVRTIVPVREEDVYLLANHREAFAEHVGTPWPTAETLRHVQDRLALFDIAKRAGVPVPETRPADTWERWDHRTILKARYSVLADDYLESHSAGTVEPVPKTVFLDPGEQPALQAITERMGHVPIAQEYVDNTTEYGFFALYDHGEAVATFQHRQLRGYHYCGGPSAFRESVSIPALERAGTDLLDALEWHGVAMVEFLRDEETGDFRLMEVNPRFWSSLPFSVQAGADFPYYYWQLATGTDERIECAYEPGLAGHLLRGEVIYLYSVLAEEYPLIERPRLSCALWDVASSIVRHPRFDYLVADDPLPFVQDLRNAVASALSGSDESDPDPGQPPSDSAIESKLDLEDGKEPVSERERNGPPRPVPDGGVDEDR